MHKTPRQLYTDQRHKSKDRGIEFIISYEDWLEMWLKSGKYEQRGKKQGEYQMCRFHDIGPYSKNNCYIGTVAENQKERHGIPDLETSNIFNMWWEGKHTQKEIGVRFNLTQSAISKIVTGIRRSNEIYT